MDVLRRLDRLIRSYTVAEPEFHTEEFRSAWDELDAFLTDSAVSYPAPPRTSIPTQLERDFRTLEIEPGTGEREVRAAYRRLLALYHPDLHAQNPEKERAAAQITRELTAAYQRIHEHYQTRTGR